MKQKLFNQTKGESLSGDTSLNLAKTKSRFSININAKKIGKKFLVFFLVMIAITGLTLGLLMVLNSFFNTHYFEFRSPVVFQQPILLHERELLSPIPAEQILQVQASEIVPTPTPVVTIALSDKAQKCVSKYPEVAEKLKTAFGPEYSAIVELVSRESCLNPQAVNKSSGAAGLFQAYPASKLGCELSNVDCQIAWGKKYIAGRYKSVEAALLFHDKKGWY